MTVPPAGPKDSATSHQIDVLLLDYEMAREDERTTTTTTAAMAGVAVALLAGIVAVLVGDCRYKKGDECYRLPDQVLALTPMLPLAIVAFLTALGVVSTVRSFYLRSIEATLRESVKAPLHNLASIAAPSGVELTLAMTSPVRGRLSYKILLIALLGGCFTAFVGVTALIVAEVELWWQVAMVVVYGPLVSFTLREAYIANVGGRSLFERALGNLPASYPDLDVTPRARRRPASGRLAQYLLLPRPQDMVKWVFVPAAFVLGLLLPESQDRQPNAPLWIAAVVWISFEYLNYQARYQWNDIRGLADDLQHPSRAQRKRLPITRMGVRASVYASAIVIAFRIVVVLLIAYALGPGAQSILLTGVVATWLIALVYESIRYGDPACQPRPRVRAIVIWITVGGGYAVRTFVGLSLVGIHQQSAVLLLLVASAWCLGTVFVTLTWVLEAVGHCYSDTVGNIWYSKLESGDGPPQLAHKTHLAALIPFAGISAQVSGRPEDFVCRCDEIRPLLGRTPLHSPWNVSFIASIAVGFYGISQLQAAPGSALFVSVIGVAASLVLCVAWQPIARFACLFLGVLVTGAVAHLAASEATCPIAVIYGLFGLVYVVFRNSSYADLRDFDKQLGGAWLKVSEMIKKATTQVVRAMAGQRTSGLIAAERADIENGSGVGTDYLAYPRVSNMYQAAGQGE